MLADLEARGIAVVVTGDGRLQVRAPAGLLTDEDKRLLRQRKTEIIRDLRIAEARRIYAEVNKQVVGDGRFKVLRDCTVELPCGFIDKVVRFRVRDARLRVDGFKGCIQAMGRCEGPVRCYHCDRGHRFVVAEPCAHGDPA